MSKTRFAVAIVATLISSSSCTTHVTPVDVQAQRAEHIAITQDWLRYVEADAALSAADRDDRRLLAATQDMRIRALEELLK